jgi:hypothetical protein
VGFVSHPRGKGRGFAPFQGHGIYVSHQVKGDGFSIWTDVQTHPSAFGSGETYLTFWLEGKVFEFGVTLE